MKFDRQIKQLWAIDIDKIKQYKDGDNDAIKFINDKTN
jgi:hypothetical protein